MNGLDAHHASLLRSTLERYATVSSRSFEQLLALCKTRQVQKGEYLIHMGQVAKRLYFMLDGILVSQYPSGEGNIHIKNFFLKGNFAGSTVSLLRRTPSRFSIQCLESALILELDYTAYKSLILMHPDLMHFYIAQVENKWIVENEKRQMDFATASATDRYLTFLADYPGLDQRVAQHHIASYLSITPTQLSRVRKDLSKS